MCDANVADGGKGKGSENEEIACEIEIKRKRSSLQGIVRNAGNKSRRNSAWFRENKVAKLNT